MLGVRHMDIIGYNVDSARRMAVNLLLWCHGVRQRAAETDPVSAPQNNR